MRSFAPVDCAGQDTRIEKDIVREHGVIEFF